MNLIYESNIDKLLNYSNAINVNFLIPYSRIPLDDQITPLTAASYIGKGEIISVLVHNFNADLNLTTTKNGKI